MQQFFLLVVKWKHWRVHKHMQCATVRKGKVDGQEYAGPLVSKACFQRGWPLDCNWYHLIHTMLLYSPKTKHKFESKTTQNP